MGVHSCSTHPGVDPVVLQFGHCVPWARNKLDRRRSNVGDAVAELVILVKKQVDWLNAQGAAVEFLSRRLVLQVRPRVSNRTHLAEFHHSVVQEGFERVVRVEESPSLGQLCLECGGRHGRPLPHNVRWDMIPHEGPQGSRNERPGEHESPREDRQTQPYLEGQGSPREAHLRLGERLADDDGAHHGRRQGQYGVIARQVFGVYVEGSMDGGRERRVEGEAKYVCDSAGLKRKEMGADGGVLTRAQL
jgi:hypothetical protein